MRVVHPDNGGFQGKKNWHLVERKTREIPVGEEWGARETTVAGP